MSVFSIQEIKKNVKKGHRILRGWTLGAAVFQISLLYICLKLSTLRFLINVLVRISMLVGNIFISTLGEKCMLVGKFQSFLVEK